MPQQIVKANEQYSGETRNTKQPTSPSNHTQGASRTPHTLSGVALSGSLTYEQLRQVFESDCKLLLLYELFARNARFELEGQAEALFSELKETQQFIADGHLDFLRLVGDPSTGHPMGDTGRNIQAAIAAELRSAKETLPRIIQTAKHEGFADIASWLETVAQNRTLRAQRLHGLLGTT